MIAFFMSMYFLFQMISVCGEESGVMEKDKQIIEEFMKKVINTDVEKIEYIGGPKEEMFFSPDKACINFRCYRVNYMRDNKDRFANSNTFFHVQIADGEDKIFSYMSIDPSRMRWRREQSNNEKLLSTQEILESAKPLFEYLGIQGECKDLRPLNK